MEDIYKHRKNQTDVWKGCALFRLHVSVTDSWWNEPDFKCTSHCEGASRQQPDLQSSSERASKSSCDTWLKYFIENAEDLCLESLSGFIRKTTLEHNLKGRFFQRNKTFKPAIMGTRFPLRAAADFFLKHYPNAPRHIKYEYGSIDWSGQAIRALQSLTQI